MNEPQSGGQLTELALIVARLSETVARQSEQLSRHETAIRLLSEAPPEEDPNEAAFDLTGRPVRL